MGKLPRHSPALRAFTFLFLATALAAFAPRASAQISLQLSPNSTTQSASAFEADYSSTHLYIDEINGDSIPITIFFNPGTTGVDEADVFTNLNNRDLANVDNGNGVPSGVVPPNGNTILAGNSGTYFQAYKMSLVQGGYLLTLYANKTGAYRLTARYHLAGEGPNTFHWYGDFLDGGGTYHYRDAAIIVSPTKARSMTMYELDALNVDAEAPTSETDYSHRSTFVDLYGGPGATTQRPWNLTYAKNLGINWLWLQPIHPVGIAGRQDDPNNGNAPYSIGSPYSVKNYFAVNAALSKAFDGTDDAAGRSAALTEFQGFVKAADAAGMNVMLDVPFNHTSFDCELGDNGQTVYGQPLFGNNSTPGSTQFWNLEARVYSRWNGGSADQTNSNNLQYFDYGERAEDASTIALAADRFDFGKFVDVHDIYFGYYASLVDLDISQDENLYTNEGDWFDYSIGPNGVDAPNNDASQNSGNGHFDSITQNVWKYFADYVPFWLSQTGHVDSNGNLVGNSTLTDPVARRAQDDLGIDGIRADFAQGLPPQCWEYIINVARHYKWDFVFLCESLDGGNVTYRSGRHFDVLNENVLFDFYAAQSTSDFRNLFDNRRNAYGQAMVLWDTESHDEAGYVNPYQALMRYAVAGTIDGTPDIFFGQEIGISGAVVPPSTNPVSNPNPFGFSLYQVNFGKPIPQFFTYNSLVPAWNALGTNANGQAELYPVYSAIGNARLSSPALQSSNRYYLNDTSGNVPSNIFGVAKYVTANASPNPATSDVVFGFINLDLTDNYNQSDTFNVNINQNGSNLFGIDPSRTYNVQNIAADLKWNATRNTQWLWGSGRTGSDVLNNGVYVSLNPLPTADSTWQTAPYEAQYLRLVDITAPPAPPASVAGPRAYPYVIGSNATFTWPAASPDSKGIVPSYSVVVTINGVVQPAVVVTGTSYTVTGLTIGQQVSVAVSAVNPYYTANASPTSTSSPTIQVLDPNADSDGDGMSNAAEDIAGTNPLDVQSYFRVTSLVENAATGTGQITWASVAGKTYQVQYSPTIKPQNFSPVGSPITATGTTTSYTFNTTGTAGFYEVTVSQ
jgi:glycosidase